MNNVKIAIVDEIIHFGVVAVVLLGGVVVHPNHPKVDYFSNACNFYFIRERHSLYKII